ncbi:class II glutamine amidotransferase [Candidatus Gottesmanbacteria bacterium]|nr:class II glutamine amidotransferase [Candidatus Gottesmanbacteria bacterium]
MDLVFHTEKENITHTDKTPLHDHCGIVGMFATKDTRLFSIGLSGIHTLQTRGYDGAGFWAEDENGKTYSYKGEGMVKEVFSKKIVDEYTTVSAKLWVYQVRYGTNGGFHSDNVQPFVRVYKGTGETFALAHNGQFSRDSSKKNMSDLSDTALFAQELSEAEGTTWEERISKTLEKKRGAWSLVIGTKDSLYVARDSLGIRPLVYGHIYDALKEETVWVVASETSALLAMGVKDYFEVIPGTIAKIGSEGLTVVQKTKYAKRALCIFENVYIQNGESIAHLPRSRPREIARSISVSDARKRSGKILAREAPLTRNDVDMVIGVPGTGIEGGISYARTLGIPYYQAITDKSDSLSEQRTFMSARIDKIYQKVLDHFIFDKQTLKGKRVVLVDDSIVRGNIAKGLVYLLKNYFHVTHVHLRVLSPAIDKPCHLGVNTRTREELIAATYEGDTQKICKALSAESLAYLSPVGLKEALTGDPYARGFCMGCMLGNAFPIDEFGHALQKRKPIKSFIKQHQDMHITSTSQIGLTNNLLPIVI